MSGAALSPAVIAAGEASAAMRKCLDDRSSFVFEAGAGSGKTFSLIEALKYLISREGPSLIRKRQQVACITFTNVATAQIESRIDRHPAVKASTIHAFCWELLRGFQAALKTQLSSLERWPDRLKEAGTEEIKAVSYDLGFPKVEAGCVSLAHDDVLQLTCKLLENGRFRQIIAGRFPYILIDEYQDTDKELVAAIKSHLLGSPGAPLIGFFGDHWQKIYNEGCGKVEHPSLQHVGKKANFRSAKAIVECLNRMRPSLPQAVDDCESVGSVAVIHTNGWSGERRKGAHWGGDLPAPVAHTVLASLIEKLTAEGWSFREGKTKVLMLTHNVLASEQGYSGIAQLFSRSEPFAKKEDPHLAFLIDVIEPSIEAFKSKRYGEMMAVLGRGFPVLKGPADKEGWHNHMAELVRLADDGTIGEVMRVLKSGNRIVLPEAVAKREIEAARSTQETEADGKAELVRKLHQVRFAEVRALANYVKENTLFSTKHGVKGAEFENVLAVFGRGWQNYNFNQYLEWALGSSIPADKVDAFERNRNLFYVACSRPKTRLCLLFTQLLSDQGIQTLKRWFGNDAVKAYQF